MTTCYTSDISFTQGSIALLLQFAIFQDDGTGNLVPMPDASTAIVTWISPSGQRRVLSPVAPVSAIFGWTTSAREFTTPHTELGRCLVSAASGGVFFTEKFSLTIEPVF